VLAVYDAPNECESAKITKSNQVSSKHYIKFGDDSMNYISDYVNSDMTEEPAERMEGDYEEDLTDMDNMYWPEGEEFEGDFDMSQWTSLHLDMPLEINYDYDVTTMWCEYEFKLYIRDFTSSDLRYKPWADLVDELHKESTIETQSHIELDKQTGFFWIDLYKPDVYEFLHRFTHENQVYMDFKIVALIPGSTESGPGTPLEDLPSADF
jgi:hypothetical protein